MTQTLPSTKYLLVFSMLSTLAITGCGKDDGDSASSTAAAAPQGLVGGTWLSKCQSGETKEEVQGEDGGFTTRESKFSVRAEADFKNDGTLQMRIQAYQGEGCSGGPVCTLTGNATFVDHGAAEPELGAPEGSQKIDIQAKPDAQKLAGQSCDRFPDIEVSNEEFLAYSIYKIDGNKLFLGEGDGDHNGDTPETRHNTLGEELVFTR